MICSRCGELLLEDRFMVWAARWRCMKCGQVYDSKNVQSHMVDDRNRLLPRSSEPNFDEEGYLYLDSFVRHLTEIKNPSYSQKEGRADLFKRAG
jgi:hypothetical protein